MRRKMTITIAFLAFLAVVFFPFTSFPMFGRLAKGENKEIIRQSPNYRDGRFQNMNHTQQ